MIPSPFKDDFVNALDEILGVDNAWAMTHYQFRGMTVVESVSKPTDEQSRRVGELARLRYPNTRNLEFRVVSPQRIARLSIPRT